MVAAPAFDTVNDKFSAHLGEKQTQGDPEGVDL